MAFTPFTKDDLPTMAAFNEKFQQAMAKATADAIAGAPKIVFGSYVGTGTSGAENPQSISADSKILYMEMVAGGNHGGSLSIGNCGIQPIMIPQLCTTSYQQWRSWHQNTGEPGYAKISDDGKTVYWYSDYGAYSQYNTSGNTYYYMMLCE